jgi:hypothetical protein
VIRYFGSGLLFGAVVVVFVAGILAALPQELVPAPVRWALFGAAAVAVLGREIGVWSFPVPENARLVPEDVQHLGEWGALQFGFEMGTGMRTYSPSALPHLVLAAVLLVIPFAPAFALAAGFATGRLAMPLLSNAWSDDGSWTELWARSERVVRPLLALTCIGTLSTAMLVL